MLSSAWQAQKDADVGVHLGEVLWKLGHQQEAQRIFDDVRKLDPTNKNLQDALRRLPHEGCCDEPGFSMRCRVAAAVACRLRTGAGDKDEGRAGQLAAQQSREQSLAHADHWVMQGRLGVSDGKDGGSGSFSWTQNGDRYEFVLRGPAISGADFRLSGGPTARSCRASSPDRSAAPMPRR